MGDVVEIDPFYPTCDVCKNEQTELIFLGKQFMCEKCLEEGLRVMRLPKAVAQ